MTIFFGIIFCLSLAGGGFFAHVNGMGALGYAASLITGGFIGSSLIALIFTWLYFFQKETDKEKIERLQQEINERKGVKKIER